MLPLLAAHSLSRLGCSDPPSATLLCPVLRPRNGAAHRYPSPKDNPLHLPVYRGPHSTRIAVVNTSCVEEVLSRAAHTGAGSLTVTVGV